jgi:hypothetical protein
MIRALVQTNNNSKRKSKTRFSLERVTILLKQRRKENMGKGQIKKLIIRVSTVQMTFLKRFAKTKLNSKRQSKMEEYLHIIMEAEEPKDHLSTLQAKMTSLRNLMRLQCREEALLQGIMYFMTPSQEYLEVGLMEELPVD